MRYVEAKIDENQRDLTYRFYISDAIFALAKGSALAERFSDLYQRIGSKADNRTGEEIIDNAVKVLGIEVIET